jgi:hypothetical protein
MPLRISHTISVLFSVKPSSEAAKTQHATPGAKADRRGRPSIPEQSDGGLRQQDCPDSGFLMICFLLVVFSEKVVCCIQWEKVAFGGVIVFDRRMIGGLEG